MRTVLQERHRPLFANLNIFQTELVWNKVVETWPGDMRSKTYQPTCGEELFVVCRDAGLDHARVVLSMAREHSLMGVAAIETLVGKPIAPWAATVAAQAQAQAGVVAPAPAAPPSPPKTRRVVLSVCPVNPHRPGTVAHTEFAKWRVGATLDELLQKGMQPRAIRRGPRRGWVVLGDEEPV